MSWFKDVLGLENAAGKLTDTHHDVTVKPGAVGRHKVDHRIVVDPDVKRGIGNLAAKLKKMKITPLKALGAAAAAAGAVSLGSSAGKNIGDRLTGKRKPQVHVHVSPHGGMAKSAFWDGFKEQEKKKEEMSFTENPVMGH